MSARLSVPRVLVGLALVVSLGGGLSGCRLYGRDEVQDDDDGSADDELSTAEQEVVADASEVEQTVRGDSGLAALPTFAFTGRKEPLTLSRAVQLQVHAPLAFFPQGCVTVETTGNVVTYTFDGCTGPLGLVSVSGKEIVTFRPGSAASSIEMTMESEGLSLGGRPVQHDAVAVLTLADASRRLTYDGSISATTAAGIPVMQASDLAIETVDGSLCATIDGTSSATVGPRGLEIAFGRFQRCGPLACPTGTITSTALRQAVSVSVAFDGSDTAIVTTARGREVEVDLACSPHERAR